MSKTLKIQCTECNALNGTHVEDIKNTCIVVTCANVEDIEDMSCFLILNQLRLSSS